MKISTSMLASQACLMRVSFMSTHLQVIQVEGLLQGAQGDATEVTAPQELDTLVGHNDVVLGWRSRVKAAVE
jgi:hypothetical protein